MRYGIGLTAGDPHETAELAAAAELAGWDGVFTWDAIAIGAMETYDPWVMLAAMAIATERITLGALLTPPSRRRPWKLAREALSIDHLSHGRLVLPVGLGALEDSGFGDVGEATDARTRAELLDETLAILDGLWSGEPFAFEGRHHRFGPMTFRPTPVQRPRIPIWVVGAWPAERSMLRAARWDGLLSEIATPEALAEAVAWVAAHRDPEAGPYEVIAQGTTPADDPAAAAAIVRPWVEAGASWWIDADWQTVTVAATRARIEAGPPRLSTAR